MFLGHFGAGLSAKAVDGKPSLGTLFFASQLIDLIWPVLLILGIEKVVVNPGSTLVTPLDFIYYPFTHSLVGVLFWAILFGGLYFLITGRKSTSLLLAALVLSHWFLDLLVHKPDLPLMAGIDYKAGLGAWNSLALTLLLEFSIFGAGAYLYLRTTRSRTKKGTVLIWSLLILLIFIYLINIFGPPPPDSGAIGYVGLSQWLLVGWGYWIDRNRVQHSPVPNPTPEFPAPSGRKSV